MKTIYPDYNNCLTNVTNSIFKHYNLETYHDTLPELDKILEEKNYKNIVYMLYDGMGANLLKRNLKATDFLNQNKLKTINAVFPPTTTAATTSVLSGKNPNEHGWLGWDLYFKDIDKTVTMFLNTLKDTDIHIDKRNVSEETYPYKDIVEKLSEKTNSHILYPFGENAYTNLDDMHQRIIDICNNGKTNFIYAYVEEPDHTIHEFGTDAEETIKLFKLMNDKTEALCSKLEDTLVILVADHGHINCQPITLSDYEDVFKLLSRPTSIEPRACAFFIKNGEKEHFEELFYKYFAEDFILLTKEEVVKKQIFGTGKNNKHFEEVIGDYLAIATSNKFFRYDENSVSFKSMHAGITEDEVLVPLIIAKDKKINCKLIGMDFDDTLLTDEKKVTEETSKSLKKARDAGIVIVGMTARTLGGTQDIIDEDTFDYLILNNGAYVYNPKNKMGYYKDKLNRRLAEKITETVENYSKQIDYCSGTAYYIYKGNPNQSLSFIKKINSIEEITEEIARMNVFPKDGVNVEKLLNELIENYPETNPFMMQDSSSTKKWIVINPNDLNKKVTLEDLGRELNIPLEEMTFFGDGLNDLEVIEVVGNGVAMENALKEVKDRAKDITLSNNDDGIAHYIKRKILKK